MGKLLKDPLFRRFVSGSFFAAAFVWVAVRYFRVDTEVIWVFLKLSFVFVVAMIVIGLLVAPIILLVRHRRRSPGLLDTIEREEPSEDHSSEKGYAE